MDEKNSQKPASEEDDPPGLATDGDNEVHDAEEETCASRSDEGQADHYMWGLSWHQFLTVVLPFLGMIVAVVAIVLKWQADTISQTRTWQKERARIVLSSYSVLSEKKSAPPLHLFFSLNFKNVGETTALNTYGAWLQGECQYASPKECVPWCAGPLEEQAGKAYGFIASQGEYVEKLFSPLKTGKARKKQRPIYFCGYVAYTDMHCMWHRQFYVVFYEPATDKFGFPSIENDEQQANVQDCRP